MRINVTTVQRTLVAAAVIIGCGAGVYALGATQANSGTTPTTPLAVISSAPGGGSALGITVTGTGNATGTPDKLQLSLEVDTQASSAGAALDAANRDMRRVRDSLRAHGVADADLQTSGLSVQARYGQQGNITGYQVTESLTAVLRDLARAGETITAASTAAGNAIRIDGVSLDLSDSNSSLLASARASAMADAKTRATQYADAAGRTLGQVLVISEVTTPQQVPLPYASTASGSAAAAPVPISPGKQQVSVTVTVTYELG